MNIELGWVKIILLLKKDKSQEGKVKYYQVLAGTSPHVPLVANNRNK